MRVDALRGTLSAVIVGVSALLGSGDKALAEGKGGVGCSWDESAAAWALARHLPSVRVSGSLGQVIVPFLHARGVPVSYISRQPEGADIHVDIPKGASAREVLEEIVGQAPAYRFAVFGGKIVIYPRGEEYERRVEIGRLSGATRARAMYALLRELKAERPEFRDLELPIMRGGGGTNLHGDRVEIGGVRSLVEHFISVTGTRPAVAFRLLSTSEGAMDFRLDWVKVVEATDIGAPMVMNVGDVAEPQIVAKLIDGTAVRLEGKACGVEYVVGDSGALEVDGLGRLVARKVGREVVVIKYDGKPAQATVEVR